MAIKPTKETKTPTKSDAAMKAASKKPLSKPAKKEGEDDDDEFEDDEDVKPAKKGGKVSTRKEKTKTMMTMIPKMKLMIGRNLRRKKSGILILMSLIYPSQKERKQLPGVKKEQMMMTTSK
ncbi:MAG: hypothetical protein IPH18_14125 [Chitinophagaceae bacterium]|nr:hypothetical protein [Chitinophagaceae bacterium]